jgi:hypothetical protein
MIDALGSVSEFSIGLAGFSGVAAALLQRNRSLQEIDRLRVTINVVVSLTPGIWALVLIALLEMGVPVERAVRWASVGFLTTHLGWIAMTQWMRSKLPDEQKAQFNPVVMRVAQLLTMVSVPLNVYNIVIFPEAASGILVLVLVLGLVQGGSMFAGMLWQLMGSSSKSPNN